MIKLNAGEDKPAAADNYTTSCQLPIEVMSAKSPGQVEQSKVANCISCFSKSEISWLLLQFKTSFRRLAEQFRSIRRAGKSDNSLFYRGFRLIKQAHPIGVPNFGAGAVLAILARSVFTI